MACFQRLSVFLGSLLVSDDYPTESFSLASLKHPTALHGDSRRRPHAGVLLESWTLKSCGRFAMCN